MAPLSRNPRAIRWRWLLPVALLVVVFHFSAFSQALDRAFFDASSRHPLRATPPPGNSALVLVDEQTLSALSQQGLRWPFPRAIFAQLIVALQQAGAAQVVVDFTFFEETATEQDQLRAAVAAASPSVVLARTSERPPVFWSETYRSVHPQFFSKARTGFVEFTADEDGVARTYVVPGSLAAVAFDPPALIPGGLIRWHGGLEQVRAQGVPVLSAAPYIAAGKPILEHLISSAPDLDPEAVAKALAEVPTTTVPMAVATPTASVVAGASSEALLAELDQMSRERNELAAELAILRAGTTAAPIPTETAAAKPRRERKKKAEKPAEISLGLLPVEAPSPSSPTPSEPDPVPLAASIPETEPTPAPAISACPQPLSEVKGIDSVLEQRLYAGGIGSYWSLAQLSDDELAHILELGETERAAVDLEDLRHDAARLARDTNSVGRRWNGSQPDDLERLVGLGPAHEQRLYEAGICTYEALGSTSPEVLATVCPGHAGHPPDYAHWIAQARALRAARES